jgi:hypothetical protein
MKQQDGLAVHVPTDPNCEPLGFEVNCTKLAEISIGIKPFYDFRNSKRYRHSKNMSAVRLKDKRFV